MPRADALVWSPAMRLRPTQRLDGHPNRSAAARRSRIGPRRLPGGQGCPTWRSCSSKREASRVVVTAAAEHWQAAHVARPVHISGIAHHPSNIGPPRFPCHFQEEAIFQGTAKRGVRCRCQLARRREVVCGDAQVGRRLGCCHAFGHFTCPPQTVLRHLRRVKRKPDWRWPT